MLCVLLIQQSLTSLLQSGKPSITMPGYTILEQGAGNYTEEESEIVSFGKQGKNLSKYGYAGENIAQRDLS